MFYPLNYECVVHSEGFEPTTPCSEDKCSNPLSYECVFVLYHFFCLFKSLGGMEGLKFIGGRGRGLVCLNLYQESFIYHG